MADGDGVAIRDGERDRAVACGGFRDGDSGEHVGEDKCRFVVGVTVGVHGVSPLLVCGFIVARKRVRDADGRVVDVPDVDGVLRELVEVDDDERELMWESMMGSPDGNR